MKTFHCNLFIYTGRHQQEKQNYHLQVMRPRVVRTQQAEEPQGDGGIGDE